ncbi:ribonuclease H-like domain-containing protein [Tanacetum coccineum]|uniref:Ribonuclease H-like domain-containing protein n=1 Tax=Tanacetum coccineum TaxID=301880 RepID=A0ABQ5EQ80_9ASTR
MRESARDVTSRSRSMAISCRRLSNMLKRIQFKKGGVVKFLGVRFEVKGTVGQMVKFCAQREGREIVIRSHGLLEDLSVDALLSQASGCFSRFNGLSARCQGVGFKYDMLMELTRREKIAGIRPDEDLDIFMKGFGNAHATSDSFTFVITGHQLYISFISFVLLRISTPCNASHVLSDLVNALEPLALKQQRAVQISQLPLSLEVAIEEPALRQAISNLIEGALLRTNVGGMVEIVSTSAPASSALIIIDDDGPDMHYMGYNIKLCDSSRWYLFGRHLHKIGGLKFPLFSFWNTCNIGWLTLDDENPPPLPPPPQTPTQQAPHTVSTIKLPILKKGEYDIWAMKMEHYLSRTNYPIWEVIQKGNCPDAIKSRFGGNDESKKMQKYILKQQFEGFSVSISEGLHKGYDRFQSLLSQLEIHGVGVSTKDANQKLLRSLPSSWSQVSLVMRTKPGVDSLSFDDLYNNLRVFEYDVKDSTRSSSNAQNVAFVSSESTSSTNDVSTAYGVSTSSG